MVQVEMLLYQGNLEQKWEYETEILKMTHEKIASGSARDTITCIVLHVFLIIAKLKTFHKITESYFKINQCKKFSDLFCTAQYPEFRPKHVFWYSLDATIFNLSLACILEALRKLTRLTIFLCVERFISFVKWQYRLI